MRKPVPGVERLMECVSVGKAVSLFLLRSQADTAALSMHQLPPHPPPHPTPLNDHGLPIGPICWFIVELQLRMAFDGTHLFQIPM